MFFFVLDFLIIVLHLLFGRNYFFNLDFECNLPNFYSALKFFLVCFLAWLIFRKEKKWLWFLLATNFFYLGLDDVLMLHEKYGSIIFYKLFSSSGLASFYSNRLAGFSWYPILFLPGVLLFIFLFYFWRKKIQPPNSRVAKYFLFAIICLVVAFILEPVGVYLWPKQSLYQIEVVFEEGLELFATSFFFTSLYKINKIT
jgi:hypothetical protein